LNSLFEKKVGGQDKTKKKYDGQKKPYNNFNKNTKKPDTKEGGPMTFKSNNKNDDGLFMTEKERNQPTQNAKVEKKEGGPMAFKSNNKNDDGLFMTEKERNQPTQNAEKKDDLHRPEFKGKIEAKEYKPTTVQDINIEKKEVIVKEKEIEKPQFKVKDGNLVDINTGADLYSKISFKEDTTVYHDGKKHEKDGEGDKKQEKTYTKNNDRFNNNNKDRNQEREREYKPKKEEVVVVEEVDSDGFIKIDSTKKKNPSKSTKYENNEFRGEREGKRGGYKKPYNKDGRKQYKNDENKESKGQYKSENQIGVKGEIKTSEMADGLSRTQFEEIDNKNETTGSRKISTETRPVTKTAKVVVDKKNLKDMFG
jgi:hypothetical protein